MEKYDFYRLPRGLQDRFIESAAGLAVPLPIAARPVRYLKPTIWALAIVLVLGIWIAFVFHGYGELESSWAIGGGAELAVHVVVGVALLACVGRALLLSWESAQQPYENGIYLFPAGVIEAVGAQLTFHPIASLRAEAREGELVVTAEGSRFVFSLGSSENSQGARQLFEDGKQRSANVAPQDALERARLHCLVESGVPNPLAPSKAHPRAVLVSPVLLALLSVVIGGALGWVVWSYRNSLSEKALYRAAVHENTTASYQAYLARGGRRAEVSEIFLPRARLEEAMKNGGIEQIVEFAKKNGDSKIRSEIDAALRSALLAELEHAKEQGTLRAIADLQGRYPEAHLIANEIAAARHAVYERAYQEFLGKAAESPDVVEFSGRLLAFAEKHGPRVQIRFLQEFPQDKEILDGIVKKAEKYFLGNRSLPVQYFVGEPARRRETLLGQELLSLFSNAFPVEVLNFELAPLPAGENEELSSIEVPTLTIVHRESLSGGFVAGAPKSMFLGATVRISGLFQVPAEGGQHEVHFSTWKNPTQAITEAKPTEVGEVYENMMSGAFRDFFTHYKKKWFKAE